MRIIKVFTIVTLIVTASLFGYYCMIGDKITLSTLSQVLEISVITGAIVVAIWFLLGYWFYVPFVRFLNRTFEMMGR